MARILVIDDYLRVRQFLRMTLEEAGHEVFEALDGAKGLALCRQQAIHLVFCDVFMPEKEGLETIRELRREFPEVKIVAMSGGSPGLLGALSIAAWFGAAKTLTKPFDRKTISEAVQELLL